MRFLRWQSYRRLNGDTLRLLYRMQKSSTNAKEGSNRHRSAIFDFRVRFSQGGTRKVDFGIKKAQHFMLSYRYLWQEVASHNAGFCKLARAIKSQTRVNTLGRPQFSSSPEPVMKSVEEVLDLEKERGRKPCIKERLATSPAKSENSSLVFLKSQTQNFRKQITTSITSL